MEIKAFKLVTGEEILGEIIDKNTTSNIRLKNPVGIAVVRGPDGKPNVGFAPFPLYAPQQKDATIDIPKESIVYSYTPADDFLDNYNQVFGAGIVLPKPQQIITG
jgi:hypothetical protein